MIAWSRIPLPLWAYAAVTLVGTAIVEATASAPIAAKVLLAVLMLLWLYLLFRGLRLLWTLTVLFTGVGLLIDLLGQSPRWQSAAVAMVGLALLLLPSTRRYCLSSGTDTGTARKQNA